MRIFLFLLFLTLPLSAHAEEEPIHRPWEASLGNTQMFIGWYKKGSYPVPTSSATLILSREVVFDFSLWAVFNLPLNSNRRVTEEGLLVESQTPPTFMLGLSYEFIRYGMSEGRSLGLDAGFSVGRPLTLEGQLFPVGAFRLKLLTKQDSSMYAGITTSPYNPEGDLVWGLISGMGYKF